MLSNIGVPGAGLEPARPNEHMPLKHACLPISAPGPNGTTKVKDFAIYTSPLKELLFINFCEVYNVLN